MKAKKLLSLFSVIVAAVIILVAVGMSQVSAQVNPQDIIDNVKNKVKDIQMRNQANVENIVNTDCNSGGNQSVGNGSINTGDCGAGSVITNQVNTNVVECCTPTPKPSEAPSGTPTPTPTTTPGVGGNGGQGGNGGGGGGAGGGIGGGEVLGLAVTSGENELLNLLKLLPAFGSLTLGFSLLRKNA